MSVDDAIEDSVAEFGAAFNTGEPQKFMNEFLASKRRGKGLIRGELRWAGLSWVEVELSRGSVQPAARRCNDRIVQQIFGNLLHEG